MAWIGRSRKQDPMVADAIEHMDEAFPFWLSKVLNIGQPIMDKSVPTAAIQYDKRSREFTFRMNPEFAAELTTEERAFLMSHEAMHVVRNDMALHSDPRFPDKEALNQAMDAIINDTLTNAGLTAPDWAILGPRDVGFDCEDMSIEEVYEAIIENRPPPEEEGSEGGDEQSDEQQPGEGEGGGQSDDTEQEEESEGDSEDGEGEADQSDDETEGDDQSDGDGADDEEADGDDTEEDEDEDGGAGSGDEETDEDNPEQDAGDGDDETEGGDEQDSDTGDTPSESSGKGKPMAGGGHDGWGDCDGMADAAEMHADTESEIGGDGGEGDATPYAEVEGSVTNEDLTNLDFEAVFRLVEPELVDGFGIAHPARADWRRPRRTTMSMYPTTIMPSRRDDTRKLALASKRMQIVVFLDNSGSVSGVDIATFGELAKRLPKARADYIFVAAATWGLEVSAEDMFSGKRLPHVGLGNGRHSSSISASHLTASPETEAGAKWLDKAYKGRWGDVIELDAMNGWIHGALETGRLRSYPKAIIAITDGETTLSTATPEQAARWTVLTNDPASRDPREYRRRIKEYGYKCMIPDENFHRIGDFILTEAHTVKKARV